MFPAHVLIATIKKRLVKLLQTSYLGNWHQEIAPVVAYLSFYAIRLHMFHVSASDDAPGSNDCAVFGYWNSIDGNCFRVGAGQIGRIGSRQFGEIKSEQGLGLISA